MKRVLSYVLVLSLFFVACSKDDDGKATGFDGSMNSISDFIGQDLLDVMIDLGLVIHEGSKPPVIEGEYVVAPCILDASNVEIDVIGTVFADQYLKLYNQRGLEVMYSAQGASQTDEGTGSFISGGGDYFSIFLITTSEIAGYQADTAYVLSGKKTVNGFEEFQMAAFMKNNHGNPGGVFIADGKGRIFIDGDGVVEKI